MGFPERTTIARPAVRLDELPTRLVVTYQTTYANEIKIFNIEYVPYLFENLLINPRQILNTYLANLLSNISQRKTKLLTIHLS